MTNKLLKVLATTAVLATVATSVSAFTFTGEKQEMPLSTTAIPNWEVAVIERGDTLSRYCDAWVAAVPIPGIASIDCQASIAGINGIRNYNLIQAGARILLPTADNEVATVVARIEERGQVQSLAGNPLALAEGMLTLRDRISQLESAGLPTADIEAAVNAALDGRGFVSNAQLEAVREEIKTATADTMTRTEVEKAIADGLASFNVPEGVVSSVTAAVDAEVVNAINARLDALEGRVDVVEVTQGEQAAQLAGHDTRLNELTAAVGESVTRAEVDTVVQTAVDEVASGLEARVSDLEARPVAEAATPSAVWYWLTALSVILLLVPVGLWLMRRKLATLLTYLVAKVTSKDNSELKKNIEDVKKTVVGVVKEQKEIEERLTSVEETLPQVKADDLEAEIAVALKILEEKGVANISVLVDEVECPVGLEKADKGRVRIIGIDRQREPVKVENLKKVIVKAAQSGRLTGSSIPFVRHAAE